MFTSLAMSTACALWATLMQQWVLGPPAEGGHSCALDQNWAGYALSPRIERDSSTIHLDSNATPKAKATPLHEQAHADASALRWTLRSLYEDHKLEGFLDGLPGRVQQVS